MPRPRVTWRPVKKSLHTQRVPARARVQTHRTPRLVPGFPRNPTRHNMGVYLVESCWLNGMVSPSPTPSCADRGFLRGKSTPVEDNVAHPRTTLRATYTFPPACTFSNFSSHPARPDPGRRGRARAGERHVAGFAVSFQKLDRTSGGPEACENIISP